MDKTLKNEIDELLYLTLEDTASAEKVGRLNSLMTSDPEIQKYVADFYFVASALRKGDSIVKAALGTHDEVTEINHLLNEMASYEKAAPSVEIVKDRVSQEKFNYNNGSVSNQKQRISTLSLATLIASAAALFILVIYAKIATPAVSVAVLNDAINAQWSGNTEEIQPGFVFSNVDGAQTLRSGIVEIEFQSGANVIIEGPSEFVCKSDNQVALNYGRLYARVPSSAIGFTVETENSKIVDLGTEFGVQLNVDGTAEMHVFKGLTKLLTGKHDDTKAISVTGGQAKQVGIDGIIVENIPLRENSFVKQIDSEMKLIRRGQKTIDIADIVGGGNGFGSGQKNVGVDPVTSHLGNITENVLNRLADNRFKPVDYHPFIDGVFVPNGATTQFISSRGDIFEECPVTQGNYFTEVANSPEYIDRTDVVLAGVNCFSEQAALFMHANLGITFDLDAVRSKLGGVDITAFEAVVGIAETSWRNCNADFWIIVDGKMRYSWKNVRQKGVVDKVKIALDSEDRFLTLVTTDGGDSNQDGTSMDSDWCTFARPVLRFE